MLGRPVVEPLTIPECRAHLAETTLGRVAVSVGALPVIRSVRYALVPDYIVFRVAPASKLRAAAANSVVAFHADGLHEPTGTGWSVLVQGLCEEVTTPRLVEELRSLPLDAWGGAGPDVFLRLGLDRVSGERVVWR